MGRRVRRHRWSCPRQADRRRRSLLVEVQERDEALSPLVDELVLAVRSGGFAVERQDVLKAGQRRLAAAAR